MKRKILAFFIAILIGVGAVVPGFAMPVSALEDEEIVEDDDLNAQVGSTIVRDDAGGACDKRILGLKPWYYGIANSGCEIVTDPKSPDYRKPEDLIWAIVANVVYDLFAVIGYIALAYVIYSGFMYLTSAGDPGKAAKATKGMAGAIVGMAIGLISSAVVEFIMEDVLHVGMGGTIPEIDSNDFVRSILEGMYGIVGIVAVCMLIYGGVTYMTSAGNASKLQKAKNTILYAIIGLVVVILAYAITYFAWQTIID